MQKRVLITGGTGFIGSNVVGELAKKDMKSIWPQYRRFRINANT